MNFEELVGKVGVYLASFIVGFVSGLVPFINSEIFLIGVSPFTSRPALLPVALLSAAGQMVAKSIIFYAGRGVFKIRMGRYERKVEAVQKKMVAWENKADLLVLISAVSGMPPFYVLSFVAGAMKLNFVKFLIAGYIGRAIRFSAVVYFPQLVLRYI